MLALLFKISIIDFLYNNKMILCIISFYGRLYEQIAVSPDIREISLIIIILKVYMSQNEFDERDNLCWKQHILMFQR